MWGNAEILVVDDMPTNLEVLTETLSSAGYTVAAATSGERALKRLQTYVPNLILLDIQMPGIDGFKTCQEIKKNPDTANIPVIFITAFSDIGSIVQGFSLGAVDYITKPFQELELLTRVKTHLQVQMTNRSLEQQVLDRTHELETALIQLRASQLQLIQQEKMSALGNLVAGIAHEINNPIGFVSGNVEELKHNLKDVFDHLDLYKQKASAEEIEDHAKAIEFDYLREDIPRILASMASGCDRIHSISASLRMFSRADMESKFKVNVHEGIDSTLLILKYRLSATDARPEIEVIQDYGELPEITCFPSQLSQVFMNLLANAIDMFDELAEEHSFAELQANPQRITIRTQFVEPHGVEIHISDNGKGMSEEVHAKIFDRKFTTKAVGKGTGLGLAIAHQVVVEQHGGSLEVKSQIGKGTEFIIRLPV